MAIDALREAYADEEVRELIRIREKARRDYLSGLEDAAQQGREEERMESLKVVLKARFDDISSVLELLDKQQVDHIEGLLSLAATALSLEEFAGHLQAS